MDSHGDFTDDEWATIYGAGGSFPVPSGLSTHYADRRRLVPRITGTWIFAAAALFVPLAAVIAVPLGVRAGLRGNRLGWLAAAVAVVAAATGYLLIWAR
jgi:hypothetical protein